ncbi:ribonuclease H-like domain-containing protein [Clostridium sp. SHJSY1]|uniref:ribonuclease H-like domain-containing protein n=1 Tax=Clostridium sp. SHJSY1 TaxID=2942483 RepID=UPI002875C4F6|nr:ribonuclease H-like domain-containing protein [Clostridium sp. SHJSY1]MDS0524738.1 ribonuclease H-like domain-containing protein [Clostridium sp. SHJSY1]
MIIRENTLKVKSSGKYILCHDEMNFSPKDLIFFDLEHYVYKKPKCIGVFGACIFDEKRNELHVTQYMIENRMESIDILYLAKKYFIKMKQKEKKAIVTFSGNNDFSVINYLFQKYGIDFDFKTEFASVDIQKEYERDKSTSIGLKNLEKVFGIIRESEVMSGSNLAKTFHKVMKDKDYVSRMPKEKLENILLYNEQDVVNLYHIFINWKQYIYDDISESNEDISEAEESSDEELDLSDTNEI